MNLTETDTVPSELMSITPALLYRIFPQPTLLHLRGEDTKPLFISTLLHGNEHTGFEAVQFLLKKYKSYKLPRSLSIFFGNPQAARFHVRSLDTQPDYNRVWPGTQMDSALTEVRLMQSVVDVMKKRGVFASIDIHNNTGINPHYACINVLRPKFLQLATIFSRTIIYFKTPRGVQSSAFSDLCPATTIECGKSGALNSTEHAFEFLDSVLHMKKISSEPVHQNSFDLFHTVARVVVEDRVRFGFERENVDLLLDKGIERLNFSECAPGTQIGRMIASHCMGLRAYDEQGMDVTSRYLVNYNGSIVTRDSIMPAMLTLDKNIIRQDCLCYFMKRVSSVYTDKHEFSLLQNQ